MPRPRVEGVESHRSRTLIAFQAQDRGFCHTDSGREIGGRHAECIADRKDHPPRGARTESRAGGGWRTVDRERAAPLVACLLYRSYSLHLTALRHYVSG